MSMRATTLDRMHSMLDVSVAIRQLSNLFKLRIGVMMTVTSLVAMAATPGPAPDSLEIAVLIVAMLVAAASAGAFNQYYETDLDARMLRTANRPFVTGAFVKGGHWLAVIGGMLALSVLLALYVLNGAAALHIFLGAFFYAIVYTVWLKRRTWLNIVIGGASGSFAVLAGAAVVDPVPGPIPVCLALAMFFWTPSHFWSLAIAQRDEYASAGVPMLPVIVGNKSASRIVLANTLVLVGCSLLPAMFGLGWIFLLGAVAGGGYFIYCNLQMLKEPTRATGIRSFLASLLQLGLLLMAIVLDVSILG